ncbi:hypothetical protein [Microbispora sp. H10949]|uniref:hypothetical protein n=1 Tax=Microbispora sp. H10949 TaxID=2729111 RepID=UPI0016038053|nr:hypothetical protein [Microbispora sp. H10949]
MTLLTYTLLTDPAPLEASVPGTPAASTGTVHLLVTNTGEQAVFWRTITVQVPVGDGAVHLTPDLGKVGSEGEYFPRSGPSQRLAVQTQGTDAVRVTDQAGGRPNFEPGGHMVLTLKDVPVAQAVGLAVFRVTENAGRTRTGQAADRHAVVALVKTAPAPRDLRPESEIVDAGTPVTLSWEGSADFAYEIRFPGGHEPVPPGPPTGPQGRYAVRLNATPKRETTYTLVAVSNSTRRQHTLTTAVQVRNPVMDDLRVTNVWATNVWTTSVGGPNSGDGAITFPQGGVNVMRASGTGESGTVTADKADLNGVNTRWVQGRSSNDGWISFPQGGVNVYRDGTQTWGTVAADTADLNGVNAKWLQGRGERDGWIDFSYYGINVFRRDDAGAGRRLKQWGGVGVKWIAHHDE